MRPSWAVKALVIYITAFCFTAVEAPITGAKAPSHAGDVEIQMRNVDFRLARDIVLEVRNLRGQLRRTKPEVPVTFDDSDSFSVNIDSARVAIAPESLTALMNSYVLAYEGAPIRNVVVTIEGDRLLQKGKIH